MPASESVSHDTHREWAIANFVAAVRDGFSDGIISVKEFGRGVRRLIDQDIRAYQATFFRE